MSKQIALSLLESLVVPLEEAFGDTFDVEISGAELSWQTENGTYLLHWHNVMQQLWLSSPVSGAHHYVCEGGVWRSTRPPHDDLLNRLSQETGITVG